MRKSSKLDLRAASKDGPHIEARRWTRQLLFLRAAADKYTQSAQAWLLSQNRRALLL